MIFDTLLWKKHSVTLTELDNLLMRKEVKRKIVSNISTIVTIIIMKVITMIKKPMVKNLKFTSSPSNRYSIHHGQHQVCTCAFL